MVMEGCYTDKEREEIQRGAAEYDQRCKEQLSRDAEYADRSLQRHDFISELYTEFERQNLEYISDAHQTIGILIKIRERFPDDAAIRERVRDLINLKTYKLENLKEDIKGDRQTLTELKRISG